VGVSVRQFLVLLGGATALWAAPISPRQEGLPGGPGKETFSEVCSLCHSTALPMGKQFTRQEWELKVSEMLQEEPDVTREERASILEYVSSNFKPGGKIFINRIIAKDMVTLLGISSSEAEAIVKYRMSNGEFKSLDDMKSVPGLDITKLDSKKKQLQF
jgi:competence protein ComEA